MARKNFSNIPHFHLIRENETIEIDSVFQFKDGLPELTSFLNACSSLNCTVKFINEDLVIVPGGNRMVLGIYATVASDPKLAEDYMTYLMKLSRGHIRPLD